MKILEPRITITINGNTKKVHRSMSPKKSRFCVSTSLTKELKEGVSGSLTVVYGKAKTNKGEMLVIDNKMEFDTIQELKHGMEAFLNKDLWLVG